MELFEKVSHAWIEKGIPVHSLSWQSFIKVQSLNVGAASTTGNEYWMNESISQKLKPDQQRASKTRQLLTKIYHNSCKSNACLWVGFLLTNSISTSLLGNLSPKNGDQQQKSIKTCFELFSHESIKQWFSTKRHSGVSRDLIFFENN